MTIKAKIEKQIADKKAEIETLDISLEESQAARDEIMEIFRDLSKLTPEQKENFEEIFNSLSEKARKADLTEEIERFEETMSQDLEKIETRFVIINIDAELMSPAGFHPEEKVFVKTRVFIQTNKLPRVMEGCKAYDMEKVA